MAEATPTPDSTGTAPATPGASPSETPSVTPPATAAVAPSVPDKYEFTLADNRVIDAKFAEAISPIFKEAGLSQELAAKLVSTYDKFGVDAETAREKEFQEFVQKTTQDNVAAMKKEWGANYQANLAVAQRGIARFLSEAGKKKLEDSGLGNDPEFMKAFYQAGKMIQEDQPPSGAPLHVKPATFTEALYGKPN